jgi:hypothetical protein
MFTDPLGNSAVGSLLSSIGAYFKKNYTTTTSYANVRTLSSFTVTKVNWTNVLSSTLSVVFNSRTFINPVYDKKGNFLGNTKSGFSGTPRIVNNPSYFKKGGSDKIGISYDNANLDTEAKSKILSHIVNYKKNDGLNIDLSIKIEYSDSKDYLFSSRGATMKNPTILAGQYHRYFETTVENIRNVVILHEFKSHIKKGISGDLKEHYKAMFDQINHYSFNSTTPKFKAYNLALTYYLTPNPEKNFLSNEKHKTMFYSLGGYEAYLKYFDK